MTGFAPQVVLEVGEARNEHLRCEDAVHCGGVEEIRGYNPSTTDMCDVNIRGRRREQGGAGFNLPNLTKHTSSKHACISTSKVDDRGLWYSWGEFGSYVEFSRRGVLLVPILRRVSMRVGSEVQIHFYLVQSKGGPMFNLDPAILVQVSSRRDVAAIRPSIEVSNDCLNVALKVEFQAT